MNDNFNFEAYFLGPKAENYEFYKSLLDEVFHNHKEWRMAVHNKGESDFITERDKIQKDFIKSQKRIEKIIKDLSEKLKKTTPAFSPRYIGHMNWEVLAAPIIAYMATALYNPNNVAFEASPVTSIFEIEAIKDLLNLFEFDIEKAWGHLCSGGTIANIEALWIARNMKFYPFILKKLIKDLTIDKSKITVEVKGQDINLFKIPENKLSNYFSPVELCILKEKLLNKIKKITFKDEEIDELFEKYSIQNTGIKHYSDSGIILLPQTKHYSFKKALDILGLGQESIRFIPVDENFRLNIASLKDIILKEKDKPIIAVVCVLGSTEEASVDEVHKVFKLREELIQKYNINFHIHIDAAYGGYARSIFMGEDNKFLDYQTLKNKLEELNIIKELWPKKEVYEAYKYVKNADSITVDPHKLGYILYPAGSILLKDRRMRESIQTYAPYVFKKPESNVPDTLIGAYILEGSKPGAVASAVWTAHKILPLNIYGYGKLIGETIDGAQNLYKTFKEMSPIEIEKNSRKLSIKIYPIVEPDLNILIYVFNFMTNKNLAKMNKLNEFLIKNIFNPDKMADTQLFYILSHTELSKGEYGDVICNFLKNINISEEEWNKNNKIVICRSVIMSPYLTQDYVDINFPRRFLEYTEVELFKNFEKLYEIYIKSEEFIDYIR